MALIADNKNEYNIFKDITLKEEQIEGIDFALAKQNCVLNLQPGTGKTMVGIAAAFRIMKLHKDVVTVIVCPKAANSAFKKEFAKTNLALTIQTTEEKTQPKNSRFFLFNYSNMEKLEAVLVALRERQLKVIGLFDEVHVVGSKESNQALFLKKIRPLFTCVIGMTGTPLLNDIEGLYGVVDFIKPGYLGQHYEFKSTFLDIEKKTIHLKGGRKRMVEEIKGYKNLEQLKRLLEKIVITRFREYNIDFMYRDCNMTPYELQMYKTAAKGILQDKFEEKVFSARLWDLQRIADGSAVQLEKDHLYSKHQLLINVIRECTQRGEAVLIYTELEDTYTTLRDVIKQYKGYLGYSSLYMITGKTKYEDRLKCEKNLKAKDIVIVTKAGNKSINLQAANNVIFYDIPFAVGDYIQMVGRVTRTDTKYSKQNVYMLEVHDTIDSYKRILLHDHMELIKEIFGKSSVMPYYSSKIDLDKYKQYYKNHMLWCRC